MAIATQYKPLSADKVRAVNRCLAHLDEARDEISVACSFLVNTPEMATERAKLQRSMEAVNWERGYLQRRLEEMLANGKRSSGCPKCGCARVAGEESCNFCGRETRELSHG